MVNTRRRDYKKWRGSILLIIENKIQSSLVYLKRSPKQSCKTLEHRREERKRWLLVWSMRTQWFTLRRKGCPAPKSLTLTPMTALIPSKYMISFFSAYFNYFNWKTKCWSLTQIVNFVRDIRDPEHPYSLEQLSVLSEESVTVDEKLGRIL